MDIQKLIEKRANLWQEAKTFLDEKTAGDGKISVEDAATYDRMEKDIVDLGKNIERLQRAEKIDTYLNAPASKPILGQPFNQSAKKSYRASDEYKKAALLALRTNFKQVNNYLQEGTDSLGGYLVPEEWDERLIQGLNEKNIMRPISTVITTGGERKIAIPTTRPAAAWTDEGAALQFGDATFGQVTLGAHKIAVCAQVTNELLYDSMFDLETYIINEFAKEISDAEEDAFLNGAASDTTRPTGVFATATADTSTVVTTAGAAISADDMIDLEYKLQASYRKNAVFIMNDATVGAIRKLKDNSGGFMWQPSYQAGAPDKILGYPVHTSTYAPKIAAGKPVVAFGDFSYYYIADRGTRSFKELRELFMGNDMTGFVMIGRVDGALVLPEAVRVLKMKA